MSKSLKHRQCFDSPQMLTKWRWSCDMHEVTSVKYRKYTNSHDLRHQTHVSDKNDVGVSVSVAMGCCVLLNWALCSANVEWKISSSVTLWFKKPSNLTGILGHLPVEFQYRIYLFDKKRMLWFRRSTNYTPSKMLKQELIKIKIYSSAQYHV